MIMVAASKKGLSVALSRLSQFSSGKVMLEQYSTEPEIAATLLYSAFMQGDIDGKVVADLGAGPGILGIGALILGAKKVFFVEIDTVALSILRENLTLLSEEIKGFDSSKAILIEGDVQEFNEQVDTIIMNPPFGTKQKHHDKLFLEQAFALGKHIYSRHKSSTKPFLEAISRDHAFSMQIIGEVKFPLKKTMHHHTRQKATIEVVLVRFTSRQQQPS